MFAPRLSARLREGERSTARGKAASPLPCPRRGVSEPRTPAGPRRGSHTVRKVRALHGNSLDNDTKLKPKLLADCSVLLSQISKWLIDHKTKGRDQALCFHEDEGSLARRQESTCPSALPLPRPFPAGVGVCREGGRPRTSGGALHRAPPRLPTRPSRWKGQDREENTQILGTATFLLAEFMWREMKAIKSRNKGLWTRRFLAVAPVHQHCRGWSGTGFQARSCPRPRSPPRGAQRTSKAGNLFFSICK